MKKPILVVMAAGIGSRYGGIKQMDPIGENGEWLLDYSIYDAKRAGFETVVFVISDKIKEDFEQTVGKRSGHLMEVRYAIQSIDDLPTGFQVPQGREKPWGTGHAVYSARHVVDAPFAVINADDYYGPKAFEEIYNYLSGNYDSKKYYEYAMVGYQLQNTLTEHGYVSRGVCDDCSDGYLTRVVERTRIEKDGTGIHFLAEDGKNWVDLSGDRIVSMNFWGFTESFMKELETGFCEFLKTEMPSNPLGAEFYLPAAVSRLIDEDKARVKVLESQDKWYGMTYKEDKPMVKAAIADMIAAGLYPQNLWN